MSGFLINPYRFGVAYDTDAQAYITAVEFADGQALETAVKDAINAFVVGCKADGIWSAIKASCILAGARTLSGALVPMVGTAPTNVDFVSGDYNRKTGLKGDGSSKYLNTNRNNNADPQDSKHLSVYVTDQVSPGDLGNYLYIGTQWNVSNGESFVSRSGSSARVFYGNINGPTSAQLEVTAATASTGFFGASRSSAASFVARYAVTDNTKMSTSATPRNEVVSVFRGGLGTVYSSNRIAFYSIGESLNLALLDSRVSTLISALAAAIP